MLCDFLNWVLKGNGEYPLFYLETNCCTRYNENHLAESHIQILKLSFEYILKEYFYSQRKLVNTFFIKQELDPIPVQMEWLPLELMVQDWCIKVFTILPTDLYRKVF